MGEEHGAGTVMFPPLEKGRAREGIDPVPSRPAPEVNPHPALRADLPLSEGGIDRPM